MFKVKNRVITTPPLQVILKLHEDLEKRGINLIRDIKQSGDNIQFTCPYHNHGNERRASCGVSTSKENSGVVHCFSCGVVDSLENMISYCFGYNDNGNFGSKWLIKNFITFEDEDKRIFNIDFNRDKKLKEDIKVFEDLTKFRYYHQYMFDRKLTREIINKFDIGFDKENNAITFPVYNLKNELCFVGRRSINGKMFSYPKNVTKPVYGLNLIPENVNEIIICESMFNALTCWVYGKYGVALLGTGSNEQYEILKKYPCRKYILAFDGDDAGIKGRNKFIKNVRNKIITYYDLPQGKDINDLTREEFYRLEEHYDY